MLCPGSGVVLDLWIPDLCLLSYVMMTTLFCVLVLNIPSIAEFIWMLDQSLK